MKKFSETWTRTALLSLKEPKDGSLAPSLDDNRESPSGTKRETSGQESHKEL